MGKRLFKNWWLLLITGILFSILGILYITSPGMALLAAGVFIGVALLISGRAAAISAVSLSGSDGWGWLLVTGILDIILGSIVLWNPFASAMLIPIAVSVWAIVRGVILFVDSFSYKKLGIKDWWGFLILGLISLIFGIVMLRNLGITAIATGWMIGTIFLLMGISSIFFSFRVRKIKI